MELVLSYVDPLHLKIVQGFSNSATVRSGMRKSEITVRGGNCKERNEKFCGGEGYCFMV